LSPAARILGRLAAVSLSRSTYRMTAPHSIRQ
jgi:hypothetical protein